MVSQKVLSLFRRFFTLWVDMYPYKVGGKVRKCGRKGKAIEVSSDSNYLRRAKYS